MATHPQGHSLLPAEHVTTPQQNIQIATTLPLNIQQPNTNSISHHDPHHPTSSHLSLSTPNSTFIKPLPAQPPASENVVSRELLPASDPVNPATTSTTPKRPLVITPNLPQSEQPNAYISDSPPKRRKSDTIPHETPRTQAVVNALTISPNHHTQQSEPYPQNNIIKSAFVPSATPDDKLSSPSQASLQERQGNEHITQHVAQPQNVANALLQSPTANNVKEAVNASETNSVAGSREPARESPPPNAENAVIRYVPDPSSSLTTSMRTSLPNSDSSHGLPVLNSSLDVSSSSATVPGVSLKRRKRDSSAASEAQANGELPSTDAELQERELKRLKSDENTIAIIPSGTKALKSDEKPLAVDAESTDSSQANIPAKADDDATKSENQSDISESGQRDADLMQVDGKVSKSTKPAKTDRAVSASVPPRSGLSLPLLRSSPIAVDRDGVETRALSSKVDEAGGGGGTLRTIGQGDGQESTPPATRKKKSVSWASEEKLVDVQYIDNRMELVRSWDADSQITLPFAPATLQMFQQALKDQDSVKRKEGQSNGKGSESSLLRSMPKLTSFEEARKREHDMEQERARQAREELKEKLNAMTPTTSWRTPHAIVLPAECRIEEPVQRFDLAGSDAYSETLPADSDASSPPSPPYRPPDSYGSFGADATHIPVIPLSDRFNQSGDNGFDASAVNDNSDSRDYLRSESRQDSMGETPNRGRPNSDRSINYKTSSDSSQEYHYSGTHNGGDVNMAHNTRPDSRMTQNPHGQYDMVPNNYPNMNAAPAPSQVQAVQHLLSALQSSGLLKPGGGSSGITNNNADYNRQAGPMHGHGSNDGNYRESEHNDQREMRDQDRDTYDSENQEDDRTRTDEGMQSQGMATGDGAMPPPLLGPGMGGPFPPGMQQAGMMDMMQFAGAMGAPPMAMPPMGMGPGGMPPPPIGIPPLGMLQMMGLPVPVVPMPTGLQMTDGGQGQATSGGGNHSSGSTGRSGSGRVVETISRPKAKPQKQRKRCKYFGTKQGCRDGNACMFAHN